LTPINDPAALALAARRLILDAGLRGRLIEAGLARIADEFSAPRVVARWRELLDPFGVR
jgi:glycosyltransferase involved in cell wall biosynthesis